MDNSFCSPILLVHLMNLALFLLLFSYFSIFLILQLTILKYYCTTLIHLNYFLSIFADPILLLPLNFQNAEFLKFHHRLICLYRTKFYALNTALKIF